ncbi:MAG TPA: nucleoside-diphosphate sugar epimerase/dehydratase [Candidatus Limnocylindrales bacterium]|nr:nucleoside-diphosphate sugar epimerase/dehydratase [Candidatus Limnocylindrales bacterium]
MFDVVAVAMSIVAAFAMRFDANDVFGRLAPYLPAALVPLLVMPPVFVAFGLYRREWRYASVNEMFAIVGAVLVGTGVSFVFELLLGAIDLSSPQLNLGTFGFPRSVSFIEGLLILALVGGSRFALRAGLERRGLSAGSDEAPGLVKTLVYGAGEVGATVVRVASRDPDAGLSIVGFLDDDRGKRGMQFVGKRVYGDLDDLDLAIRQTHARQMLIAMPRASGQVVRRILDAAGQRGLTVRTVPPPRGLVTGDIEVDRPRDVSLEDLLRREPVSIDLDAVAGYLNGASVLVTGGGGSIGSELVRQILTVGPRQLVVLDHQEEALWALENELGERAGQSAAALRTVLADVRSLPAIDRIIREVQPDVVFHAAALKHVPMVELYPSEGVMTNVLGTYHVLLACQRANVPRFVLISTDKAVDPVGAMGVTKRMAEHLTVAAAQRTGRPYVAVRFGNVLGSSGSVIPTFQQQLAHGGPITITHPDVTRFFMTITEAVSLILEAASSPRTGEIYVLDMGEPVRIVDLARDLIRLSGLDPERIQITFTGLRAGERLHENLFHDHEITEPTVHEGIFRVRSNGQPVSSKQVENLTRELARAAEARDDAAVRDLLHQVAAIGAPAESPADGALRSGLSAAIEAATTAMRPGRPVMDDRPGGPAGG